MSSKPADADTPGEETGWERPLHALPETAHDREPAALLLALPAQEQLAAVPEPFRPAIHELLHGLAHSPLALPGSSAGEHRVLETAGWWIVYRTADEDRPAMVVESLRRRAPRKEVQGRPVLRRREHGRQPI